MASSRQRLIAEAYQRQLRSLRIAVEQRMAALYAQVDLDDIDASFRAFAAAAAAVIASGQASARTLASAHLRALFAAQAGRVVEPASPADDLVGRTEKGLPLALGMAAIPSLMKREIGLGKPLPEALKLGRYLTARFADAEVTRVADATTDQVATQTPEVRGWRGFVADGACDPCQAKNAGEHTIDEAMYRHGSCKCWREWFVGGVSLREVT